MAEKLRVAVGAHRIPIKQNETVTLTHQSGNYTTRYRVRIGKHGALEIDGDVLDKVGASECEGVYITPEDKYTVKVWTI